MFDSLFWAFIGLAAIVTIAPGADTVLTIRNSLAGGTRDGLATVAGVCSGFFFQPLLAALGVAALFIRLPLAFAAVKFAGALYLVYLGVQSLREAAKLWRAGPDQAGVPARVRRDYWKSYRNGLVTNALNPKIAVFYFAVLPQFIKPGDPVLAKSLAMAGCHYVMGALWLGGIAFIAGKSRLLLTRRSVKAGLDAVCGCTMIAFGLRLAFARAR